MENKKNITTGDYFFCNGKLVKDNGLSINAKHVFEALTSPNSSEIRSVRDLVEEKGFEFSDVYSAVIELVSEELIKYDVKSDKIEINV